MKEHEIQELYPEGKMMTAERLDAPAVLPNGSGERKFVRVTGLRMNKFIEFAFSLNDADLTVELILPRRAFEEFCQAQGAEVLPQSEAEACAAARPAGLLQRLNG